MRNALSAFVILAVIVSTGPLVRLGGESGLLEIYAAPGALVVIGIYRALGPRAEHVAWAVFLFALGSVYLGSDVAEPQFAREIAALAICAGLAVLSVVVSPWFLCAGFVFHVAWDFLPRQLMPAFTSLPVACLLFDGIVAAYAAWVTRAGRWTPLRAR